MKFSSEGYKYSTLASSKGFLASEKDLPNEKILFTTLETSLEATFPPNDGGVTESINTNYSQTDLN